MLLTRLVRPLMLVAALGAIAGCATRQPTSLKPTAHVSPTPVWKIEVGDVIKTKVYREPDLSGDSPVSEAGTAYFPGLGRVKVVGLTLDSLQVDIQTRYAKLIIDPAVDVQFTRDVVIYGQVRQTGIITVDQTTTVGGLLAKAGGALGTGRDPSISLVRHDGVVYALPRDARLSSIDITRGDAVYVVDSDFFLRNAPSFGSLVIMAQLITTALSLVFIVAR